MTELPSLTPVSDAQVTSLQLTCGVCDAAIELDVTALNFEQGRIEAIDAFGACPECGEPYDASRVEFHANINEEATPCLET